MLCGLDMSVKQRPRWPLSVRADRSEQLNKIVQMMLHGRGDKRKYVCKNSSLPYVPKRAVVKGSHGVDYEFLSGRM